MTPFERAFVAHLVADWLLQKDWMAHHKSQLSHPAAWVHGAIHALALGGLAGLVLGVLRTLIDTRVPLAWWIRCFKRSAEAQDASVIAMWTDQTLHIATIATWVSLFGPGA